MHTHSQTYTHTRTHAQPLFLQQLLLVLLALLLLLLLLLCQLVQIFIYIHICVYITQYLLQPVRKITNIPTFFDLHATMSFTPPFTMSEEVPNVYDTVMYEIVKFRMYTNLPGSEFLAKCNALGAAST